jgi:GDPmannose 4,6-dehydratase
MRVLGCKAKLYQASTSEMYRGDGTIIDEQTPFDPISPYGSSKMYAHNICRNYREAFGMFISCGILFNHESPRRGKNFVTKKIVDEAKKHGKVRLGNVTSARDWGYAKSFVEVMWLMLQQEKPDDYIIATGKTTTIKQFIGYVEKELGKKIKVIIDKEYKRPNDVHCLRGNPSKAIKKLKWKPTVGIKELVKIMVSGKDL